MSVILNETPIRTSKNYKINNFKLEEFEWPSSVDTFTNFKIESTNSKISKNINTSKLAYGNGQESENNIKEFSNNNLSIETAKENIMINYTFDDENSKLLNQIDIIGNQDSTITIEYNSTTQKQFIHNGIVKAIAKKGVTLNIVILNLLNDESVNIEAFETVIEEDAKVNYKIIDLGGNVSIQNFYANCKEKNSYVDLKTIYLGKNNEKKDLNYIIHLYGEKSNANIDVQGALDDNSKKNFKGTLDFKKGCKKAKGNENEFCLLLSEKAKSIALPVLLCTEHEVEGNHGTASGKVDEKMIFYIMSRGFSYKEAVRLVVKSNFNKIIDEIKNEEIKIKIEQEIDRRL